jgi:hypothetical protein
MKIDRHNYEEFFLLYVDNELSVDQKKQVEAFVLANTDLEEELIMLQQSKLVTDHSVVFEGKASLMKEAPAMNMSNYEEWLLLYADNELTPGERSIVEKFAAAHPPVREELDLFLQAKLEPVEIVFADKASLYRREEKVRVLSMSWWRIAAAAILILAAGVGTYSIINNYKKPSTDIAGKVIPPAPKSNQQEEKNNGVVPSTQQQIAEIKNDKNESSVVKQDQKKVEHRKDNHLPKENAGNKQELAKIDEPAIHKTNDAVTLNTIESSTPKPDRSNTVSSLAFDGVTGLPQHTINNPAVTKTISETPNYKLASNMTTVNDETASNSENKKLRGFFRRATRFIEKTTKMNPANDDDKLLIGSMAVSLK